MIRKGIRIRNSEFADLDPGGQYIPDPQHCPMDLNAVPVRRRPLASSPTLATPISSRSSSTFL
jgi:hypothetical protein